MAEARFGTTAVGVVYGLAAGVAWGVGPIYWKALATVPEVEIVTHRIVWSVPFLALLITLTGQWGEARRAVGERRRLVPLLATALLISINWGVYIWAVNAGFVLEASLGYFMSPLVGVLLGVVFLRERLRVWQGVAIVLAAAGVATQAIAVGTLPWIGLTLAFSFGFYGLLRKVMAVGPVVGLGVETTLLLPLAIGYVVFVESQGRGHLGALSAQEVVLVLLSGAFTALPLLFFTAAARRLRYSTVGLLQYTAPSLQFALAVLVYGEAFTRAHLILFACVWAALLLYSADSIRAHRRQAAVVDTPAG